MQCKEFIQDLTQALAQPQDLADLLDRALAHLHPDEIFCQIGWMDPSKLLAVMPDHPDKLAVILQDPLQSPSHNPASIADIQTQIAKRGLEDRVLLLEGSIPMLLAELNQLFPDTQIGICYSAILTDYRTHLLQSLLLRQFFSEMALYIVNHCQWGSLVQANLDLMGVDPCFHLQNVLPHLDQGIHLFTWNSRHKGLTEQDLAQIQAVAPGSLLAASPGSLTFAQPHPPEPARFYPCKYIRLDDFLPTEVNQAILENALACQEQFISSKNYSKNDTEAESLKFRRSLRLDFAYFQVHGSLVREKIAAVAPQIFAKLGIETFDIQIFEIEMIASYDGCYFTAHTDNAYPQTAFRQVSCVYYFHKDPKPYRGGELRIYDTQRIKSNPPLIQGAFEEVEPINNSMVFFPSSCLHEILPVFSPTQSFADSRFTINTWLGIK